LPNVLIEAQALGVPVIAPDVGGAAEAFIPGESGVLLDQVDAVSIGKAVLDLLDDSLRLGRFSERAQQQVRQRFSISRMLAATNAVYGKAMGFEQ
jgi:glycosyltransferase involved in cell wall biosynthesis